MTHKSLRILSAGMISALLLTGCGSSNTQTSNATATPGVVVSPAAEVTTDTATYGQITSIDGSTITIELGTKKQMNKGDGQANSDSTPPSGQPEMPNGSPDANAPQGTGQPEMPKGSDNANAQKGERPSMLDLTGETKSITVTDSTVITIQSGQESSTGTVSDLQVGDTISFEVSSDDTTAVTITVQSMQRGNGQEKGGKQNSEAAPATSDAPSN